MPTAYEKDKATKYKFEYYWSEADGSHFSFGSKRLWEIATGFIVADLVEKDGGEQFRNLQKFSGIELCEALEYMRTGKR